MHKFAEKMRSGKDKSFADYFNYFAVSYYTYSDSVCNEKCRNRHFCSATAVLNFPLVGLREWEWERGGEGWRHLTYSNRHLPDSGHKMSKGYGVRVRCSNVVVWSRVWVRNVVWGNVRIVLYCWYRGIVLYCWYRGIVLYCWYRGIVLYCWYRGIVLYCWYRGIVLYCWYRGIVLYCWHRGIVLYCRRG